MIKKLIFKINILLIRIPFAYITLCITIYFLFQTSITFCDSVDWDQQWVQGTDLNKQPTWFRDNPNNDPRSLYEQMNGPAWRSIHDHYDMDNNNSKYLGYGWNDNNTSSLNFSDTSSVYSNNTSFSDNDDEPPMNVEDTEQVKQTSNKIEAMKFCFNIEDLGQEKKTWEICRYMFREIWFNVKEFSNMYVDEIVPIKEIVQQTVHNEILMQLWSAPMGQKDYAKDIIVGDILYRLSHEIASGNKPPMDQLILLNMFTQIKLTQIALTSNLPLDAFFFNDDVYDIVMNQSNI